MRLQIAETGDLCQPGSRRTHRLPAPGAIGAPRLAVRAHILGSAGEISIVSARAAVCRQKTRQPGPADAPQLTLPIRLLRDKYKVWLSAV